MFWGLIMEPGRCYTQEVKSPFHISMAAIDSLNAGDTPTQVICVSNERRYLLCTLDKKDKCQCPLDLNFEIGSKISFATNGGSSVHLTGYLLVDDDIIPPIDGKQGFTNTIEAAPPGKTNKKRQQKDVDESQPKKKSKMEKKVEVVNNDNTVEESSDEDFQLELESEEEAVESDLIVEGEDSGDVEEEEDSDDSQDIEEEEEDEDSDDENDDDDDFVVEEEEKQQTKVVKQNGVSKTKKPQKNQVLPTKKDGSSNNNKVKESPGLKTQKNKKQMLKSGVMIEDLKEGTGDPAKYGKMISVYYEGRLKQNNKVFDSNSKGNGFSFRLGKSEVIKAWDIGLVGMKVGGKRRIICPPASAYGQKGSPPVIPPNATLVFEVELKKVN